MPATHLSADTSVVKQPLEVVQTTMVKPLLVIRVCITLRRDVRHPNYTGRVHAIFVALSTPYHARCVQQEK